MEIYIFDRDIEIFSFSDVDFIKRYCEKFRLDFENNGTYTKVTGSHKNLYLFLIELTYFVNSDNGILLF